jgi:hypothetical protein
VGARTASAQSSKSLSVYALRPYELTDSQLLGTPRSGYLSHGAAKGESVPISQGCGDVHSEGCLRQEHP